MWISISRGDFNRRSAGISEAEQFRAFVERFAGGIVKGLAEDLDLSECVKKCERCVAAGGEEDQRHRQGVMHHGIYLYFPV